MTLPAVPDREGKMSAELAALNERHRKFVLAKIQYGCTNKRAAEIAGYEGDDASLRSTSYRIAHREDVLAALEAEGRRLMHSATSIALTTLIEFADPDAAHVEPAIRLKAALAILDRTGFNARTEHRVIVEKNTDQQKVDRIVAMARNLGLDPQVFLGRAGVETDANFRITKTIDAEYVEAPDDLADLYAP